MFIFERFFFWYVTYTMEFSLSGQDFLVIGQPPPHSLDD